MKKNTVYPIIAILVTVLLLMTALSGCGRKNSAAETAEPVSTPGPVSTAGLEGTWQTASMGYEDDGSMHPEYEVRFSDSDIVYGHLKDGDFVCDHSDRIVLIEETAAGGFRIQAQASNGVQYTYQTCESDSSVLEYYETWKEEEFPDAYRGGASLSRSG